MASNRSRSNRSIGNKLNNLDSRISSGEKGTNNPHLSTDAIEGDHLVDGAVAESKIADRAVTEDKIARGSVGTEHLGIVNTITADSGLTLKPGPGGGFVVIDGASYVPPASGSGTLYALGYNENKQVVVSTSGIGGGGGNGMASMPAGSIQPWPTRTAPTGWLVCDGSAVSRSTYADLFNTLVTTIGTMTSTGGIISIPVGHGLQVGDLVYFTTTGTLPTGLSTNTAYYVSSIGSNYIYLGTTRTITATGYSVSVPAVPSGSGTGVHTIKFAPYGIGDGSTTFNVPDIRGRTVVGADTTQTEFDALGERGGAKTHTLTTAELPKHTHTVNFYSGGGGSHRHWISSMDVDDRNLTGTGTNGQNYGLVADAGYYSANDPGYATGRYSGYESGHQHYISGTTDAMATGDGAHNNLQPYIALTYIIKHMVADGMQGPQGIQGVPGNAATVAAGTTTTGAPGSVATVTNAGTSSAAVLNFTIPRGDTGAQGIQGVQGPSGTVTVGSTSTGAEGTNAQVTNSGTSTNSILEFVIPRGNTGAGGTTSVGTVTTLSEDSSATVTNTGTPTSGVLNFGIPQGITGNNAGVKYIFSTTTTDADPGNGNIRANSTTLASVTSLYVDNVDFAGADRTAWYTLWSQSNSPNKGYIAISQYRSTNIAVFYVNGTVTAATGYYKIPVTYVGGSLPANSAACFVSFSMSGDVGAGMPAGGSTSQILSKASNSDYDLVWIDNYADWTSQVKHKVKAAEALTLGQAVYVSGSHGTNMLVSKASNAAELTSSKTMGLIMQTLALNGQGFVLTEGLISNLNTSTATLGDPVWLGTSGNLIYGLANKPVAPAHLVFIGIVTRVNANNGEIWVKVQNGFELDELHNVKLTNPTDGQSLTYEASTGLWKNSTPASSLESLTDVTYMSAPTVGQALTYTGTRTRTNYIKNPNFEGTSVGPTGWGASTGTVARNTSVKYSGAASLQFTSVGTTDFVQHTTMGGSSAIVAGKTYSASFRIKTATAGQSCSAQLTLGSGVQFVSFTGTADWQLVKIENVVASATDTSIDLYIYDNTGGGFYIDEVLVEEGFSVGSYFDGSTSGASWTGTVNNSRSTLIVAGEWANSTPASTLNSLTDVTITSPPVDRQVIKYDGATSQWINGAATGGVTPSDTAPLNPNNGDVWYDTAVGNMYVYSNDGNSSQWVEIQTNTAAAITQEMPAGAIMQWSTATPPPNWLICNGSAVSRTTYASLYAVIGTQYGAGDGSTTFNLPDLRGRVAVGKNSGTFGTLGATGGAETVALTEAQMPSHTHSWSAQSTGDVNDYIGGSTASYGISASYNSATNYGSFLSNTGGGQAHNNLQPYLVTNYIIKYSVGAATGDSQLATRVGSVESRTTNLEAKSPNYIINGAFDFWQRGTSFTQTAAQAYTADRWLNNAGSAGITVAVTRQSFTPGELNVSGIEGSYYARFNRTAAGAQSYIEQRIEDVRTLAGRTVTLSFYAKASAAYTFDASNIYLYQSFGSGGTAGVGTSLPAANITTSWQRFTLTATLPSISGKTINNADSFLSVVFASPPSKGTFTIDLWGVQLEEGPVATPFRRNANSLQGELAACQRYGELVGTGTGRVYSASSIDLHVAFKVTKRRAVTLSDLSIVNGTSALAQFTRANGNLTAINSMFMSQAGMIGINVSSSDTGMTAGQFAAVMVDNAFFASAEL